MTPPVLREAVSADNNSGGGADTRQAPQTSRSPVSDRRQVLGNYGYRAAFDDTHGQRLPVPLLASSAYHTPALGGFHAPTHSG